MQTSMNAIASYPPLGSSLDIDESVVSAALERLLGILPCLEVRNNTEAKWEKTRAEHDSGLQTHRAASERCAVRNTSALVSVIGRSEATHFHESTAIKPISVNEATSPLPAKNKNESLSVILSERNPQSKQSDTCTKINFIGNKSVDSADQIGNLVNSEVSQRVHAESSGASSPLESSPSLTHTSPRSDAASRTTAISQTSEEVQKVNCVISERPSVILNEKSCQSVGHGREKLYELEAVSSCNFRASLMSTKAHLKTQAVSHRRRSPSHENNQEQSSSSQNVGAGCYHVHPDEVMGTKLSISMGLTVSIGDSTPKESLTTGGDETAHRGESLDRSNLPTEGDQQRSRESASDTSFESVSMASAEEQCPAERLTIDPTITCETRNTPYTNSISNTVSHEVSAPNTPGAASCQNMSTVESAMLKLSSQNQLGSATLGKKPSPLLHDSDECEGKENSTLCLDCNENMEVCTRLFSEGNEVTTIEMLPQARKSLPSSSGISITATTPRFAGGSLTARDYTPRNSVYAPYEWLRLSADESNLSRPPPNNASSTRTFATVASSPFLVVGASRTAVTTALQRDVVESLSNNNEVMNSAIEKGSSSPTDALGNFVWPRTFSEEVIGVQGPQLEMQRVRGESLTPGAKVEAERDGQCTNISSEAVPLLPPDSRKPETQSTLIYGRAKYASGNRPEKHQSSETSEERGEGVLFLRECQEPMENTVRSRVSCGVQTEEILKSERNVACKRKQKRKPCVRSNDDFVSLEKTPFTQPRWNYISTASSATSSYRTRFLSPRRFAEPWVAETPHAKESNRSASGKFYSRSVSAGRCVTVASTTYTEDSGTPARRSLPYSPPISSRSKSPTPKCAEPTNGRPRRSATSPKRHRTASRSPPVSSTSRRPVTPKRRATTAQDSRRSGDDFPTFHAGCSVDSDAFDIAEEHEQGKEIQTQTHQQGILFARLYSVSPAAIAASLREEPQQVSSRSFATPPLLYEERASFDQRRCLGDSPTRHKCNEREAKALSARTARATPLSIAEQHRVAQRLYAGPTARRLSFASEKAWSAPKGMKLKRPEHDAEKINEPSEPMQCESRKHKGESRALLIPVCENLKKPDRISASPRSQNPQTSLRGRGRIVGRGGRPALSSWTAPGLSPEADLDPFADLDATEVVSVYACTTNDGSFVSDAHPSLSREWIAQLPPPSSKRENSYFNLNTSFPPIPEDPARKRTTQISQLREQAARRASFRRLGVKAPSLGSANCYDPQFKLPLANLPLGNEVYSDPRHTICGRRSSSVPDGNQTNKADTEVLELADNIICSDKARCSIPSSVSSLHPTYANEVVSSTLVETLPTSADGANFCSSGAFPFPLSPHAPLLSATGIFELPK